ncbi:MAG TPA: AN1-type zinc finger domain-containing protein [Candidatus Lokiarchaeia archaeon]|nr:AN1-type zinc finger domain-containing protein [Candidatus Lokiarchaeia archaeon]
MRCHYCEKEAEFFYTCSYCGETFCSRHRLPENHECKEFDRGAKVVKASPARRIEVIETRETPEPGWKARPTNARVAGKNLVSFTRGELIDLAKAWLVLSLAYCFVIGQSGYAILFMPYQLLSLLPWTALAAILTFIIHELAHKFVAEHYGFETHYKANNIMLLISLAISMTGYLFFVNGAVMIEGQPDAKQNGIISTAGPLTNILISVITLPLVLLAPWVPLTAYLFGMNAFIALFNMLPVGILDGSKIYRWKKGVFAGLFVAAAVLVVVNFLSIFTFF